MNYISFITLWHRYCSNIKIQPARSDLCDKCDQMLVSLQHSLSERKMTSTTNTSSRPKHSAIATIQILRMLRRNGEGRDRRIVTRSWVAWTQGSSCLPSPHMPIWTCRCSTPLTIANRCHCPIAHSSEAPFTNSGHPTKSRCLVCVVSHSLVKSFFLIDEAEQIAVVVVNQLHTFFHWERNV